MLLAIHNVVRWIALVMAVVALVSALRGVNGTVPYAAGAKRLLMIFTTTLHAQLVLGILLFATSPFMRDAMKDMGGSMKNPATRFFIAEHPTFMIGAVIAATLTGILARRGPDDVVRHRRAAIGIALALGLILAGMPWERAMVPAF